MYVLRVNGMKIGLYRSFNMAKKIAERRKGKAVICRYNDTRMPKATMLSYNDMQYAKREIFREIYSENNHGYHFTRPVRKYEN